MTIDLALGDRSGRHPVSGEGDLESWARALALVGSEPFAAWPPRRRREFSLIRAHLAPINSRRALAASFGRESFHQMGSARPALTGTLLASPVLAAYATRWLELPEA